MNFDKILDNLSEQVFEGAQLQELVDLFDRVNKMWLVPYQFHDWDFKKMRTLERLTLSAPDANGWRVWTAQAKAPEEIYCSACGDRHKEPLCY